MGGKTRGFWRGTAALAAVGLLLIQAAASFLAYCPEARHSVFEAAMSGGGWPPGYAASITCQKSDPDDKSPAGPEHRDCPACLISTCPVNAVLAEQSEPDAARATVAIFWRIPDDAQFGAEPASSRNRDPPRAL